MEGRLFFYEVQDLHRLLLVHTNKKSNVRTYNIEERSCKHFCRKKEIRITYSKCVVIALVNQLANFMHHVILSSAACPALPYFSKLPHER